MRHHEYEETCSDLLNIYNEVLGLAGGEVSLPCGSSQFPGLAPDDEPILVLWFREGSATPILSADARRGGGLANAKQLQIKVVLPSHTCEVAAYYRRYPNYFILFWGVFVAEKASTELLSKGARQK
ncbi:hypothetical protein HPB48_004326 [Haemaphysalis longicornis]|uniref:Uncharacterized protein n=1 Tax=Haemaphysalis longicornis TaxID=44386 RepID=A0A9J6G1B0_HAELO|nr:hypothetical protein HPB48_004326 [Haemaphysalis longicornis]